MTATLIDSHCHLDRLDLSHFDGELGKALSAAADNDVSAFLCVGINLDNLPAVMAIAREHANVHASIGVHPNENEGPEPTVEQLVALAEDPKVVAIGETGLDYFRSEGDLQWQRDRFRRHITAAKQAGKPLIVHSREAKEDTLRVLEEEDAATVGGVMHCFVEDWPTARRAMEMGFYISFSGIVTFNSARDLQAVARQVPSDRLLVETDAPYLAPVPHRGKPNQPAYVRFVAEKLAELRGESYESLAAQTTDNFHRLFGTG